MSKVLTPQKATTTIKATGVTIEAEGAAATTTPTPKMRSRVTPLSSANDFTAKVTLSTNISTTSGKSDISSCDFEDFNGSNSILEFLSKEQDCCIDAEPDPESIFQEVSRLADSSDMRTVDELLLEAERLIQQQMRLGSGDDGGCGGDGDVATFSINDFVVAPAHNVILPKLATSKQTPLSSSAPVVSHSNQNKIKMNTRYTRRIENVMQPMNGIGSHCAASTTVKHQRARVEEISLAMLPPAEANTLQLGLGKEQTPSIENGTGGVVGGFAVFVDNLPSESVISEESTPKDMFNNTANERDTDIDVTAAQLLDNTDDDEDTMEEITEGIETLELPQDLQHVGVNATQQTITTKVAAKATTSIATTKTTKATKETGTGTATTTTVAAAAAIVTATGMATAATRINATHAEVATFCDESTALSGVTRVGDGSKCDFINNRLATTTTNVSIHQQQQKLQEDEEEEEHQQHYQQQQQQQKQQQPPQYARPATTTQLLSPVRSHQPSGEQHCRGAEAALCLGTAFGVSALSNSVNTSNTGNGKRNINGNGNGSVSVSGSSGGAPCEVISVVSLSSRRGSLTTKMDTNCTASQVLCQTQPRAYSPYEKPYKKLNHRLQQEQQQQHDHQEVPDNDYQVSMGTSMTTSIKAATTASMYATLPIRPMAMYCDKSVGASPKQLISTLSSPIEQVAVMSITREHTLKQEIEVLQEKLKDTEERLESVRIQHDTLSQMQRALRDTNTRLQEESEMLKLDVQHLNECANVLRAELQAARQDRNDALELQKTMRVELEESQQDRKRAHEQREKDMKVIQDLQRQCREMERILMRKHPDSVSALIVASKNSGICSLNDQENLSSRKLLEQRIAQLESDAKEQDRKAQQILANVQARFNTVQAKYETHIADLETQVLSLQEINTKLNAQIESQVRALDHLMQKRAERYYNNCTQTDNTMLRTNTTGTQTTDDVGSCGNSRPMKVLPAMRDHSTNTIGCTTASVCQQHSTASSSTSSTANSTPNNSRPNSKQSGGMRRLTGGHAPVGTSAGAGATLANSGSTLHVSKLPISQSDSTLSLIAQSASGAGGGGGGAGGSATNISHTSSLAAKEDTQLLTTVRNMRVDLAIKNKAMQRLTRELDECKKTIRKLQRERESGAYNSKCESKLHSNTATTSSSVRRCHDGSVGQHHYPDHVPASTENQALREAQNKCRLLETDYKALHDKRLQDLKTLQSAHERELASCNETVRVLQQRLNERDDATQKRRKVPVDYYALKAKVSLLERRHSEREERLHMLVEALSKGRLNGALEDLLQENNNK